MCQNLSFTLGESAEWSSSDSEYVARVKGDSEGRHVQREGGNHAEDAVLFRDKGHSGGDAGRCNGVSDEGIRRKSEGEGRNHPPLKKVDDHVDVVRAWEWGKRRGKVSRGNANGSR